MRTTILAIGDASGDPAARAAALAEATGLSLYEARRHLAAGAPRVLATHADPAAASAAASALAAAGFAPLVLDDGEPTASRFVARSFVLEGRALLVTDRHGASLELPFSRLEVFVRGIRILTPDEREPFFEVHAADAPVAVFLERGLQYDGLRLERQPTAAANFVRMVNRLRGQAPYALYDERLNTRVGQLQVLGETLAPETHLEVATLLLARTLRKLRPAA